jgi:NarL family two-component system response regulator LiaR
MTPPTDPARPAVDGRAGPSRSVDTRVVEPVAAERPAGPSSAHAGPVHADPRSGPTGPIRRVVVLDDHRMFTEALALSLAGEADLRVVDRCAVSDPGLAGRVAASRPDVVVVDVEPVGDGAAELVADLLAANPGARVLVLTGRADPERLVDAVRAGATGWLTKDCSPGELLAAVRAVGRGGAWLSPADLGVVLPALRAELDPAGRRHDPLGVLSRQERRVLAALVDGASGVDIAAALQVSEGTVRTHLHKLFGKLGVHSRLEAVRAARAAGMRPGATTAGTPNGRS